MRAGGLAALALVAGCSPAPAAMRGGIVSTNPCADAILVKLVPAARIAAISRYSQDPMATSMRIDVARRLRATAGTAEEVIALAPSLVLTSSFTPAATRGAYDRAGLRTVMLDSPTTIAASKAQVDQIAAAVGAIAAGRRLNAAIDRGVAAGSRPGPTRSALFFLGGDLANGPGTLLDEMMRRAGLANAATRYGLAYSAPVAIETLVAAPPALIVAPPGQGRGAALRARLLTRTRQAMFPRRLVNCGGPSIAAAMIRLGQIRDGVE